MHSIRNNLSFEFFESSKFAGGRCRSFYDKKIGIEIDNGNHLVFSANENFLNFCKFIGSKKTLKIISPNFGFYDLKKKKKWNLSLQESIYKLIFSHKKYLIPGTSIFDYFSFLKFLITNENKSVFELVGKSAIYHTFWEPLTIGVMNTCPKYASARVLSNVLKKTIFKGKKFCHILQPSFNWNKTLIEPSSNFIKNSGNEIQFNCLLKKIEIRDDRVINLIFNNKRISVGENDRVILCIPPTNLNKLLPDIILPKDYNTILNIHFKISKENLSEFKKPIFGFINSISDWIFIKHNHISVTVSDANSLNIIDQNKIANIVWNEICSYLGKKINFLKFQIVREKKATYHQSPKNFKLIKKLNNIPNNILLAGDWTQHNLPCTIEGSILSGKKAIEFLNN